VKAGQSRSGWFKSSRSGGTENNCVETRFDGAVVHIRDSKYQGSPAAQPVITVTARQWSQFLATLTGQANVSVLTTLTDEAGNVTLTANGTALTYTPAEWKAFTEGVALGEFSVAA
jgi:hypothetical protein